MPYVANIRPNGLMELAQCSRQGQVLDSEHLTHSGAAEQGNDQHNDQVSVAKGADAHGVAESEHGACAHDDQIGRVLSSSDPTLVTRLRLRARLHLEALKVMDWCFFMLDT